MQIIREGQPPQERIWKGICQSCKTVAEAKQSELSVTHDRDGAFAWHICPVCKTGPYRGLLFYPKN